MQPRYVALDGYWQTIASASSPEELRDVIPAMGELPKGTVFRILVHLEWWAPMGPFFDLFGAEQVVGAFWDVGAEIRDVWSAGWHDVVVECVADPVNVVALLGVIAAVLIGLSILIASIAVAVKTSGGAIDLIAVLIPLMVFGVVFSLMRQLPTLFEVAPPLVEKAKQKLRGG